MYRVFILLFCVILFNVNQGFTQDSKRILLVGKKGYYFTNENGKKIFKKFYSSASWFSEGKAVVSHKLEYGVIDSNGKIIIPMEYYDIMDFHEGLTWFKKYPDDLYGLMNSEGKIIMSPSFIYADDFHRNYAIIGFNNTDTTKYGDKRLVYDLIDAHGTRIFDSVFSYIDVLNDSTIHCQIRNQIFIFDKDRKLIETSTLIKDTSDNLNIEKSPYFFGGEKALINYLIGSTTYPKIARNNNLSGTVYVTFVVNKEGFVTNTKIIKSVFPSLDKEALRVCRNMPQWIPGEQNGEKVNCRFNMPIRFTLQ